MFFVFKPEVLRHESCVYRSALLTGMSEGQQVQGSYALCPQNWTDTTLPVSLPRKKNSAPGPSSFHVEKHPSFPFRIHDLHSWWLKTTSSNVGGKRVLSLLAGGCFSLVPQCSNSEKSCRIFNRDW